MPKIKIIRNIKLVHDQVRIDSIFSEIGMGSRRAISTSKMMKIIAIRKNRRENGSREEDLGSNPHSNGDLFSRSIIVFFDNILLNIITAEVIVIVNIKVVIINLIT